MANNQAQELEGMDVQNGFNRVTTIQEIFELERFNSRFLNEVNAKGIVNKLYFKKVIPQDIKTKIERANSDEEANVILYEHVQPQGVKASAKMLFEIMRDAVGYHKMNHLGAEMLECLIQDFPDIN